MIAIKTLLPASTTTVAASVPHTSHASGSSITTRICGKHARSRPVAIGNPVNLLNHALTRQSKRGAPREKLSRLPGKAPVDLQQSKQAQRQSTGQRCWRLIAAGIDSIDDARLIGFFRAARATG
ncbi:MAG TPA: hypothetical protein VJ747_18055 [Stellaceae bacterium]|nr:hypothetical protein [Stellaceae bacterium]